MGEARFPGKREPDACSPASDALGGLLHSVACKAFVVKHQPDENRGGPKLILSLYLILLLLTPLGPGKPVQCQVQCAKLISFLHDGS